MRVQSMELSKVLELSLPLRVAVALQSQATQHSRSVTDKVVSTDPPYYDNIGYADLSDFFYVWLRRSLRPVFPDLSPRSPCPRPRNWSPRPTATAARRRREAFFLDGMTQAMHRLAEQAHPAFPVTIYYAFKQSESDGDRGHRQHRLGDLPRRGDPRRLRHQRHLADANGAGATACDGMDSNALASSIVLVCRKRAADAPTATRREFVAALKAELPVALAHLQRGNIAPVDLAQAAIGPGMAVYTRYAKVLDAAGKPLSCARRWRSSTRPSTRRWPSRKATSTPTRRWAVAWFEQSGFDEGEYGVAETLSKAKNTSVAGMVEAGILRSSHGKVRLLKPSELPADWDPATDKRLTAWEAVHHLIRTLEAGGESAAAELAGKLGSQAETARELAYRLYTVCERKKRAAEALSYNGLVQSWPEITRLAREGGKPRPAQTGLFDEEELA